MGPRRRLGASPSTANRGARDDEAHPREAGARRRRPLPGSRCEKPRRDRAAYPAGTDRRLPALRPALPLRPRPDGCLPGDVAAAGVTGSPPPTPMITAAISGLAHDRRGADASHYEEEPLLGAPSRLRVPVGALARRLRRLGAVGTLQGGGEDRNLQPISRAAGARIHTVIGQYGRPVWLPITRAGSRRKCRAHPFTPRPSAVIAEPGDDSIALVRFLVECRDTARIPTRSRLPDGLYRKPLSIERLDDLKSVASHATSRNRRPHVSPPPPPHVSGPHIPNSPPRPARRHRDRCPPSGPCARGATGCARPSCSSPGRGAARPSWG